jgi:hypothetical protein
MYRLLRVLTLITAVALLPMHAPAMAAANPECSRMAMPVHSASAETKPADCAGMTHADKAKSAVADVDCCSPQLVALPVALPGQAVVATVPHLIACDSRLAERCLSPPERPPRS